MTDLKPPPAQANLDPNAPTHAHGLGSAGSPAGPPVCSICGAATAPYIAVEDYRYNRCDSCGFVALNPMPTPDELAALYSGGRAGQNVGASGYGKANSRARRALVKGLRLRRYFHGKDALDFGCGGGFIVDAMRRWGARTATGLDIDAPGIAYARQRYPNNRFYLDSIEQFLERGLTFDFIYASEVFEHIGNLDQLMRFLIAIARPGSTLYVTTPDIGHRAVPRNLAEWPVVAPPHHVQFFTHDAMKRLLEKNGYFIRRRYFKLFSPGLQVLAQYKMQS